MGDWIDSHSVNCYFCAELVDERECQRADKYNGNDGGSICLKCVVDQDELNRIKEFYPVRIADKNHWQDQSGLVGPFLIVSDDTMTVLADGMLGHEASIFIKAVNQYCKERLGGK